jgi:hypothetical protein
MTKDHLLGLYQTKRNHIQLTYASLILWSYPDTPHFFTELYAEMKEIPKPFPNLHVLLIDDAAMRIACQELYESAYRSAIKELFSLTKLYCHSTGQLQALKSQPWFQFWRILRNCWSHDMVFSFNPAEKAVLPVTWSGTKIELSMNGKHFTHGHCSFAKLYELIETAQAYVKDELA